MKIVDIIDNANKEYAQNGRSKKFVSMEDRIVNSKKLMQVYWFARYVQGADIDKLQAATLKNGSMEDCFYFAKYVNDCDIKSFLQKAIDEKDEFWIQKFVGIAVSPYNNRKGEIKEFESQLKDYGITLEKQIKGKKKGGIAGLKKEDIDSIIEKANIEYNKNGRSEKFIQLEKDILFTNSNGADIFLFAKYVQGADIKELQKHAILHGSPLDMFLLAQEVDGTDANTLLTGIELAQYDYIAIQKREKRRLERLKKYKKKLDEAITTNQSEEEIFRIKEKIREVEAEESYLSMVRDYKRRVEILTSNKFGNQ